jgi:hypothetical protein
VIQIVYKDSLPVGTLMSYKRNVLSPITELFSTCYVDSPHVRETFEWNYCEDAGYVNILFDNIYELMEFLRDYP